MNIFHSSFDRIYCSLWTGKHCSLWTGKHRLGSEHICFFLAKKQLQTKKANKQTNNNNKKKQKGVTLYEVKHQKNFDDVLVLYSLSLNFEYLLFAIISVATWSMCFANWFNFANVKTIWSYLIETGNRNSKE